MSALQGAKQRRAYEQVIVRQKNVAMWNNTH